MYIYTKEEQLATMACTRFACTRIDYAALTIYYDNILLVHHHQNQLRCTHSFLILLLLLLLYERYTYVSKYYASIAMNITT